VKPTRAIARWVGSWWALTGWTLGCFTVVLGCAIAVGFVLRLPERSDGSTRLDSRITTRLVAGRTGTLTSIANGFSRVGSTSVLLPLVLVIADLLVWRRRFVLAGLLVLAWGGSIGLYDLTKPVVNRPRPPVSVHLATAAGSSFPSGHATQSLATFAALAAVVAVLWRPARVAGWVVAALVVAGVGWSRVYLGMHWATDVAAGWLIGAAWVTAMIAFAGAARALIAGMSQQRGDSAGPR
jgi:membrane-associated phospholipid phosphatase